MRPSMRLAAMAPKRGQATNSAVHMNVRLSRMSLCWERCCKLVYIRMRHDMKSDIEIMSY